MAIDFEFRLDRDVVRRAPPFDIGETECRFSVPRATWQLNTAPCDRALGIEQSVDFAWIFRVVVSEERPLQDVLASAGKSGEEIVEFFQHPGDVASQEWFANVLDDFAEYGDFLRETVFQIFTEFADIFGDSSRHFNRLVDPAFNGFLDRFDDGADGLAGLFRDVR